MNVLDWILLGGIGVAVFVAVRAFVRSVKWGLYRLQRQLCLLHATKKYEKIVLNLVHAQIPLS